MSDAPTYNFGELRSLLQQQPSYTLWGQLCELLISPEWDVRAEEWMSYVQDILDSHWRDDDRVWPAQWRSLERPPAALALVRSVDVDIDWSWHLYDLREALLRHKPPLTSISCRWYDQGFEQELGMSPSCAKEDIEQLINALAAVQPTLRELRLHGAPLRHVMAKLIESDIFAGLSRLELTESDLEDDDLVALLSHAPPALTTLTLDQNRALSGMMCELLGTSARPAQLDLFVRGNTMIEADEAQCGLWALARVPWANLLSLWLDNVPLSARPLEALLSRAPKLRSLNISGCVFDDALVEAICSHATLDELDLTGCILTDQQRAKLRAASWVASCSSFAKGELPDNRWTRPEQR